MDSIETKKRRLEQRPMDKLADAVRTLKKESPVVYASVYIDDDGHPKTDQKYIYWKKHEQARSWEVAIRSIYGKHESFGTFELWQFAEALSMAQLAKDRFVSDIKQKYKDVLSLPEFSGLEYGDPKGSQEAEFNVVYWVPSFFKKMMPTRKVRGKTNWHTACKTCSSMAVPPGNRQSAVFCIAHGGGCPHSRHFNTCLSCNPKSKHSVNCCAVCAIRIDAKRHVTKDGNGICPTCEEHQKAEAAAAGAPPPPTNKRWEDVVLDKLEVLVVDSNGDRIPWEMRDDMRSALGSLVKTDTDGKRTRGSRGDASCGTTTFRRPDLLYLVREPTYGRIVAALSVEVDEDSHESRKIECENGKVDDTFQALQKLAAREGVSNASFTGVRGDASLIYYQVFKMNPNACDVKPPVKLEDRIAHMAAECRAFLTRDPAEYQTMPESERMVPHVKCMFYHSKAVSEEGTNFLEHFPTLVPNWDYQGNDTVATTTAAMNPVVKPVVETPSGGSSSSDVPVAESSSKATGKRKMPPSAPAPRRVYDSDEDDDDEGVYPMSRKRRE